MGWSYALEVGDNPAIFKADDFFWCPGSSGSKIPEGKNNIALRGAKNLGANEERLVFEIEELQGQVGSKDQQLGEFTSHYLNCVL